MAEIKILVPTDFRNPSTNALQQAIALGRLTTGSLELLHIAKSDNPDEGKEQLQSMSETVQRDHGITCNAIVEVGDIFEDIGRIAEKHHSTFLVVGTNGIHGIAQQLFGARILKVLRSVPIPAVVVQEGTAVLSKFEKILVPVDDLDPFDEKVNSVIPFAKWCGAEVMLYAIQHPMKNEAKIRENIQTARKMLSESGINFSETEESPTVFSAGIAKQTLKFAETWGADLIVISACETPTMADINQADCERVLNNDADTAVLCAPEGLNRTLF